MLLPLGALAKVSQQLSSNQGESSGAGEGAAGGSLNTQDTRDGVSQGGGGRIDIPGRVEELPAEEVGPTGRQQGGGDGDGSGGAADGTPREFVDRGKCLLRDLEQYVSSRRSDAVDPPSEHTVLTVEVLIQGATCRADGTISAGVFEPGTALENRHGSRAVPIQPRCKSGGGGTKSHGLPRGSPHVLHHSGTGRWWSEPARQNGRGHPT